jgi:hypothetical protein
MIFSSLIALAGGVAWKAIPITDEISVSVGSVSELVHLVVQSVLRAVGFSLAFIPPVVVYMYGKEITRSYLKVGGFSGVGTINIHILTVVVFSLMSVRIWIYLISVGYINQYTLNDLYKEVTLATFAGHIVLIILASIPFIISHVAVIILANVTDLTTNHPIFFIAYMWTVICLIGLYSIDLWAEKEDHPRLAEDENS